MTKPVHKDGAWIWVNVLFLCGSPFLAAILVPWYLIESGSHPALWITAFILWAYTGMGITTGYHRLVSHRSYDSNAAWKVFWLIGGAAAIQNSALTWSASHRRHHKDVDTDDDPYNAKRGFWWSHMEWILHEDPKVTDFSNSEDLLADPIVMWQHRNYDRIWMLVNIVLPLAIGFAFDRMWGVLLIAGLLRVVLVHQGTFCINSLCHILGTQPWSDEHTSRDHWISALFTFGEGYHNFHHTFAADYRNGLKWYHFDPGKWAIWTGEKLGWCSNLKRTSLPARLRKRFEMEARGVFAGLETLDETKQATWRERLEVARSATQKSLSAWGNRVRKAAKTKDAEVQAAVIEAEAAFRHAHAEFEKLGQGMKAAA